MSNKFKILAGILLVAIAMLIYLESGEKREINWFPSYTSRAKIPFGTYVIYEALKEQRTNQSFIDVRQPPFTFLEDSSNIKGTYFFANDYVSFDTSEVNRILTWVSKGNTLFVASREVSEQIRDTLHLKTSYYYDLNYEARKPLLELANTAYRTQHPYFIDREVPTSEFTKVDTLHTYILGDYDLTVHADTLALQEPKVHFVKQTYGEGEIILHLMPEVFTNYFVLEQDNYKYTQAALSYIPQDQNLYWDHHYKNGKSVNTSPLYVLFQNRYLKGAYYVMIVGVLLWVIFEGRRKQRAIPIVKPLPNQTLAFTKTIAGMYLDKKDHTSISRHQINHFLEYIRSHYNLPTQNFNEDFIIKLAAKSSNSLEDTRKLINFLVFIRTNNYVTQNQITTLNKQIEDFKK